VNAAAPPDSADDLKALYQEIILEHGRRPRNSRLVENPTCTAKGNNPLCGDRVTVSARVSRAGAFDDLAAEGRGCAISIASASLMTEVLKGHTPDEARRVFAAVQGLCTGKIDADTAKADVGPDLADGIDRLAALSGVSQFPVRVKCATLPWHALMSCLEGRGAASSEQDGARS
jgi:nitrogen fixation NifU-like protein